MSMYLENLNRRMSAMNKIKSERALTEQERAERRWLAAEIFEEEELVAAYHAARDECIHNDPTGQDLDAFHEYDL